MRRHRKTASALDPLAAIRNRAAELERRAVRPS
jgi:hypothetical protein